MSTETITRDESVQKIAADYGPSLSGFGDGPCMDCGAPAVAHSRALDEQGFRWCVRHFVELIVERVEHEAARHGHEAEIDLLVGTLHDAYHRLDDARTAIEKVAVRFPECSAMPLGVPTHPTEATSP